MNKMKDKITIEETIVSYPRGCTNSFIESIETKDDLYVLKTKFNELERKIIVLEEEVRRLKGR